MKSVIFDNGRGFALGYDEAARRAEPPKEPDKAKHNKSREDR